MSTECAATYAAVGSVHERRWDARATWGIGLILAGVAALAARMLPGANLATMWPLFFVVVGAVQMVTPDSRGWSAHRFAEGVGTAIFGVVLLGCTTGYVAWSMWLTLVTLWPLLLVVAGVRVLSRATGQAWLAAVATGLVWGTLLFCAAGSWTGARAFEPLSVRLVSGYLAAPESAAAYVADTIVESVTGAEAPVAY